MTAQMAAAIAMTGAAGLFLWFGSQKYMLEKHEAISMLFTFVGLFMLAVDVYTVSEFLRLEIDADLGALWINVMLVILLVIVFVLFYFILMFAIYLFGKFQRANEGFSKEDGG